jgi:hypothetical protein
MKNVITLFVCLIAAQISNAQAKAVFVELGGPGLASINYDMRFKKKEDGLGGRIGFGGFSLGEGTDKVSAIFVPIGVNYLLGRDKKNYFEIGGGVTPVFSSSQSDGETERFRSTFGHLSFGYRYQPENGGFFFRANIVPIFGSGYFVPYYAGLSFGYKF